MCKPLVQRLATSKTITAPLLPLFLRLSSAVESESNRCVPLLPVDKGIQYIYSLSLSIDKNTQYIYSLSLSIDKGSQYIYHLSLSIDKSTQYMFFTSLSIDKSIQNMFFISLSIDKGTQNMYFSPFLMDSEFVHCNFHALFTTKPFILTYHQLPTRTK